MLTSLRWLNRCLEPANLTADEAEAKLIAHSFPIETREDKPTPEGPDTILDVEVTSNRGDCLSHIGLARELAATTGRRLKAPTGAAAAAPGAPRTESITSVLNHVPEVCPRFTARVIRGVKVGPSPAWLVSALESIGQRTINNVVDVSNFVLHELGHPSHTFDLNTLRGKRLVVRYAHDGEKLVALDKREHTLKPTDVVVADAERAVSLAGVIGGLETGVTEKTTDVLLELATWDPVAVRRAARRLDIRTDASHRFERLVPAGDLAWASARCAELIMQVAGGTLCDGLIEVGNDIPAPRTITLRADRLESVLGKQIEHGEVLRLFERIGIQAGTSHTPGTAGTVWACTVPHHRPDLLREVDLIEEVARLHGLDNFTISPTIAVRLDLKHPAAWSARENAVREIGTILTGLGFFETVTFSFIARDHAEQFTPPGLRTLKVDDARRPGSPFLRPSIIPSLLTCRRANQDGLATPESGGGVRLFELGAVFAETDDGTKHARETREQRHIGLIIDAGTDAESAQRAVRTLRGTVERLARALGRGATTVTVDPMPAPFPAADGAACAGIRLNGHPAGYVAMLSREAQKHWGLDERVAIAEICLGMLIDAPAGASRVTPLPAFPGIERDLSVVVDESVPWAAIEAAVIGAKLDKLVSRAFVGTYRGKQVGSGRKSVTLRLGFRDDTRTLRHEEVDPQISTAVAALKSAVGAELRA